MKRYVQVYTGNGKGKTTAAFGLALRAAGAGFKVYIGQFMKGKKPYSEHQVLAKLSDAITVEQYGRGCLIRGTPEPKDVQAAQKGLQVAREVMLSGKYQVIILDEANVAVHLNLISAEDLLDLIRAKPEEVELVITGRYADPKIVEAADLVTEMREVKHYYQKGVRARKGIEK